MNANELYKEHKENIKVLYDCSKSSFIRYVNHHQLKEIPGEIFHSSYYIDKFGNKLAYMETNSWGPAPIYKITE